MGVIQALARLVRRGRSVDDLRMTAGDAHARIGALIGELDATFDLRRRAESSAQYLEAELTRDHVPALEARLELMFGAPFKPFGKSAAFDGQLGGLIASRGGVRKDQCLYACRYADGSVAFAALWPWSNGRDLTLKLGVYAERVAPSEL